jgi:hypothetical protein
MKTWKRLEQKVARMRNTERTPLSGGNSKQTRSDTLDDTFFIECKLRANPSVWKLYEETEALAKKENKIPIVVIKKKGARGELFIVNDKYLKEFIEKWFSCGHCEPGTDSGEAISSPLVIALCSSTKSSDRRERSNLVFQFTQRRHNP